jgi:hypothetical protein
MLLPRGGPDVAYHALEADGPIALKESEWLCPNGHGRTFTSLAPAGLLPAA